MTFNNFTGYSPYGAEFSPNGRFLYISAESSFTVSQYDLLAGSFINIANSQIVIVNDPLTGGGALQLAPDNKIYAAHLFNNPNMGTFGAATISVINNPDNSGLLCNLTQNSVALGTGRCLLGLPTFYSSIFLSNTDWERCGSMHGK